LKLAWKAFYGYVSYAEAYGVLLEFPNLLGSLESRGFKSCGLEQYAGAMAIARIFRVVLYASTPTAQLKAMGITVIDKETNDNYPSFLEIRRELRKSEPEILFGLIGHLGLKPGLLRRSWLNQASRVAWKVLNDLANAGPAAVTDELIMHVIGVLFYFDPKVCERYLSGLNYAKLNRLEGQYKDKKTFKRALAACNDTPSDRLTAMLFDSNECELHPMIFDRIKDQLTIRELENIILSDVYDVKIRREVFDLASLHLTEEWLEAQAENIIDVPAILTHPKASPDAKLASVAVSAVNTSCANLLRDFAEIARPADIEEIFDCLAMAEDSDIACENLKEWVASVIDNEHIPSSVLFKIAKGDFSPEKSIGAMQYFMDRCDGEDFPEAWIKTLRDGAKTAKVRAYACFCDLKATVSELVDALKFCIPGFRNAGEVCSYEVEDIAEARYLMMIRYAIRAKAEASCKAGDEHAQILAELGRIHSDLRAIFLDLKFPK